MLFKIQYFLEDKYIHVLISIWKFVFLLSLPDKKYGKIKEPLDFTYVLHCEIHLEIYITILIISSNIHSITNVYFQHRNKPATIKSKGNEFYLVVKLISDCHKSRSAWVVFNLITVLLSFPNLFSLCSLGWRPFFSVNNL